MKNLSPNDTSHSNIPDEIYSHSKTELSDDVIEHSDSDHMTKQSEATPFLPEGLYQTDPALFKNVIMTPKLIRTICRAGPCQPGLTKSYNGFPIDSEGRHFQRDWYQKSIGNTGSETRKWLVYSPSSDKMFCHFCWMFADKSSDHYNKEWSDCNCGVF